MINIIINQYKSVYVERQYDIVDKFKQFQYYKIQNFLKSAFSEVQCLGCSRHSVKPCLMNFNRCQQKHSPKYNILHLFIYPHAYKQKKGALLMNCAKYLKCSLLKHGWLRRDAEVDSCQWCSSFKTNLLTFYDEKFQAYAKVEYHNERIGISQGLLSPMINFWSVSFSRFNQ